MGVGVGGCFSDGGRPMGGDINFGGGGGGFEKNRKMWVGGTPPLWETLESGHIKKFVR